jgi:hypothetical protein
MRLAKAPAIWRRRILVLLPFSITTVVRSFSSEDLDARPPGIYRVVS